MYNLSVKAFQILSLITQDLWIVQIIAFLEFVKRVVKAKIDILISASKIKNNSTQIFRWHYFVASGQILYDTHYCIQLEA